MCVEPEKLADMVFKTKRMGAYASWSPIFGGLLFYVSWSPIFGGLLLSLLVVVLTLVKNQ